ncbi:hypothetical protein L6452_16337 [Arctium lappa]|uniref:Uncharacterized protein n=1 Tax=Arctium lappa TaxID=4217 RepID=A0ACB9C0I6_ARCLA|nr:hypothetical protein L6452_16337 [Arctium lappa]
MAAYAYDRVACKLCGEYARLNFPDLKDPTRLGVIGDCERMEALKIAVDKKIQAIRLKVREAAVVAAEAEVGCWSLARMPSYDPDLIWEVLAN